MPSGLEDGCLFFKLAFVNPGWKIQQNYFHHQAKHQTIRLRPSYLHVRQTTSSLDSTQYSCPHFIFSAHASVLFYLCENGRYLILLSLMGTQETMLPHSITVGWDRGPGLWKVTCVILKPKFCKTSVALQLSLPLSCSLEILS